MKKEEIEPLFQGNRLKFIRTYHSLTLQELADKLDCSKQALSRYESGTLTPSKVVQLGLCSYFKVDQTFFTRTVLTIQITGLTFEVLTTTPKG